MHNNKQYAIRKKGEGEFVLTYKKDWEQGVCGYIDDIYLLDEFAHGGHDEWLVQYQGMADDVLNNIECRGQCWTKPKHNLNTDDYEVVCIERKITVCQ